MKAMVDDHNKSSVKIRQALPSDLDVVVQIYEEIHSAEESGTMTIGWQRGVYPVRETAEAAIERGDLYVLECDKSDMDGMSSQTGEADKDAMNVRNDMGQARILGSGIINRIQVDVYSLAQWEHDTDKVCVLHTLTISPQAGGQGYGKAFVRYYERWAADHDLPELRIDTNARNKAARAMYRKMGYKEIGIVSTTFNGISGVDLVLLEKYLQEGREIK